MNFRYYINYAAIVEEGSLTAAARKLHVAQPALSNQVKALEELYGARLFHRGSGSHRLELTDAGRILYDKAKLMIEAEAAARNEIANAFDGTRGSLRLGITDSLENRYLMRALDTFAERYPNTEIMLHESRLPDLLKMLQSGVVEGLLVHATNQRYDSLDVLFEREDYLIATYEKGVFFEGNTQSSVSLSELSKFPLCVTEGQVELLRSAFKEIGAAFTPKFIGSNTNACLIWARSGKGVALVPRLSRILLGYEDLPYKSIADGAFAASTLSIVAQKKQFRSRVINNFMHIVADLYGENLSRIFPDEPNDMKSL